MIKKSFLLLFAVMLLGCSYGEKYLKNPQMFVRDPHFTQYKENRDALESEYLHKEITYAEYVEQRDRLDAQYDKEVYQRTQKIMSQE